MSKEEVRDGMLERGWGPRDLSRFTGIDENKITKSLGKANRRFQADEMDAIRKAFAEHREQEAPANSKPVERIPHLGKVPAGSLRQAFERAGRYFAVSDPETPHNAYALTVEGDSMDLVVPDGATIVIDPDDTDLWPGRRYVIRTLDGDTTFKEYQSPPARLVPCSSNEEHREIMLGSEPIKVLGRVFSYTMRDVPRRSA